MAGLILFILWLVLSTSVVLQYKNELQEIEDDSHRIFALIVFAAGGPFFTIVNVLSYLLDMFMPEGWNDDDDIERY